MSIWIVLILIVVFIQWAYFAALATALIVNHGTFKTEIAASVEQRDLHGRFKQHILEFYLQSAEDKDVILGEDRIVIEREKGTNKPSTVYLNPRFERDFLFGVVIAYEDPIKLEIPSIEGETREE